MYRCIVQTMETIRIQSTQPPKQPLRRRHLTQQHQQQRLDTFSFEERPPSDEGCSCMACYRALARRCRSLVRGQPFHDSISEQDRLLQKVIVSRYCAPHLSDSQKIGPLVKVA